MTDTWTGTVTTQDRDAVRVIVIDHAPRNLLNPGVMARIREELLAASDDPAVDGIVLIGAGEVFCGGLDVPAIQAGADPIVFAEHLVGLLAVFPDLTTPVVAAVNGDAVASGASLVAACDFAVAVEGSRVGTYEVSLGIWPFIAQVPVIQRIGARAAMENIGAGEPFPAARALEVGLVQRVVPADAVMPEVLAWLAQAARAKAVVATGRPSVYALAEMSYQDALAASLQLFVRQFDGD